MSDDEITPSNAMNFFKQMAQKNEDAVPKSVSSAAAMFGGQLKSRTASRGENGKPTSLASMEIRKSLIRDRSESRERRRMSVERSRTMRGESRDRVRTRGDSRERRHQSSDRRRDRSEDRRSTAMTIRRTESRSRREPSSDRTKARIDREISLG